ncbi:MAG: protein TolR [Deltaproteobacteria bacterium]|nr:protein TolR [Deltaproteobacteria bacterium]
MAFQNSNQAYDSPLAEINITPLVDVMLVLLIIFMVTAPLMTQGVNVDLPQATTQAIKTDKEDVILTINKNGSVYLGTDTKSPFSLDNLGAKLSTVFAGKAKKELYLRADKKIPYGTVVQVMAACKNAGVERMGMITEAEAQLEEK